MQIAICDDEQKELKVIRTALDTYREAHPEYSFDIDEYSMALDVLHRVCISEIASVESQSHYLNIHLSSGEVLRLRMKLSEMFGEIQEYPEFFKVGASYIVNFNFVRSVSENTIEMLSGATIPVPRRSIDEVQKKYMEFCRKEVTK